jgi:cell division transport system permease protein
MILLQTSRAFRFAFQNFKRNLWLSIVTVIILAVATFSVSLVAAINALGQRALQTVEQRVDVSLELKRDATDAAGQALRDRLSQMPEVQSAVYQSKSEALEEFKQLHQNDANINELLAELTENPLMARIVIKARHSGDYSTIIKFLENSENAELVENRDRDFKDTQVVVDKLTTITNRVRQVGMGVSAVFILLSLIVVLNTIRIAIYTHREEIGIMRLVGASNGFIRAPFILESLIYGIIGAGISLFLIVFMWQSAAPALHRFFFYGTDVNITTILRDNFWSILGLEFFLAVLLCVVSSTIATRRYLKV